MTVKNFVRINLLNSQQQDSRQVELEGDPSGTALAKKLKKELPGPALALLINDQPRDLNSKLEDDDRVKILTFEDSEGQRIFWHSSAHLLAQAVKRLYPQARPTIGPPIEEGFFYDFAHLQVAEEDLKRIEMEIIQIISERPKMQRIEFASEEEARQAFADNPFKLEIISGKEESLSAYSQGEFLDLCTGPHIPHFGLVGGLKILKTSGAYWRGDAEREQLTRIYGISFPEKKRLREYLHLLEEARKRDHRLIGRKLELFSFHEEAPGMPFFHPKGMLIWEELSHFIRQLQKWHNYIEIKTPTMLSQQLWETSGHWENYRENMYLSEVEKRLFAIKPMNCPGCMLFYKSGQYSYRQLPLRIAEIGHVHRHEMSGALSGLFRVRSFHQDDAHIFMQPEDIVSEIGKVVNFAQEVYSAFGLTYHLELSTRPQKSIGSDEQWQIAVDGLRQALEQSEQPFQVNEGDGAFYGPKIDFHIRDCIGRTWQCGTIQLDMSLPERFDLLYDAPNGTKERPVMIHRAIYGSMERFLGILIEHYGGRFPLWLSPTQLRLLTVADRHQEFALRLKENFRRAGLRAELDDSSESIGKKVRRAQLEQANYIVVVGDREQETEKLTVRSRSGKIFSERSVEQLRETLCQEYRERSLVELLH